MPNTVLKSTSLAGIGIILPGLIIAFAIAAVILFRDRIESVSIPLAAAGMFIIIICLIMIIFTAGRIRSIITHNNAPIIGRPPPRLTIIVFGVVIPAILLAIYGLESAEWILQPTNIVAGLTYSILFSFCTLFILLGITERYGGL